MSVGSEVRIFVPLKHGIYSRLTKAIQGAVERAKIATQKRVERFAKGGQTQVPVLTGKLRDSVKVNMTATGMSIVWSAMNQDGTFDYAEIQDTGKYANYYSQVTKDYARMFFHEELIRALEAINTP